MLAAAMSVRQPMHAAFRVTANVTSVHLNCNQPTHWFRWRYHKQKGWARRVMYHAPCPASCSYLEDAQLSLFHLRQNPQIMRVVHQAEDIPEWIDHRGGDKPGFACDQRLVFRRPHPLDAVQCGLNVIHMPEDHGPTRPGCRTLRSIFTVDDAEFVLIITNAEFDIG